MHHKNLNLPRKAQLDKGEGGEETKWIKGEGAKGNDFWRAFLNPQAPETQPAWRGGSALLKVLAVGGVTLKSSLAGSKDGKRCVQSKRIDTGLRRPSLELPFQQGLTWTRKRGLPLVARPGYSGAGAFIESLHLSKEKVAGGEMPK